MAKTKIMPRNIYDEVIDEGIRFEDPSLTWQDDAEACDVNNILKDYQRTGLIRHINNKTPQYGDFTALPMSLHEAFMAVDKAKEAFAALPAKLREEIGNDPSKLDAYIADPKNQDKLVELGLMTRVENAKSKEEAPQS